MDSIDKKDIIVDLMNFLIEPNHLQAAREFGLINSLSILTSWINSKIGFAERTPEELLPDFFSLLQQIDNRIPPMSIQWEGHPAPYILYQSLIGECTNTEILSSIKEEIKQRTPKNSELFVKCAEIIFDPKKNTQIMQIIPASLMLLRQLKTEGYTIHILANWNHEAFQELQKQFRSLFEEINGSINLSGKFKIIKCVSMYKNFFSKRNIDPQKTITIETEENRIKELKTAYPMLTTLLCKNKNLSQLTIDLQHLKVLSK